MVDKADVRLHNPEVTQNQGVAGGSDGIEITPEMVEAGASVLRESGRLPWNAEAWVFDELALDVFQAMARRIRRHERAELFGKPSR